MIILFCVSSIILGVLCLQVIAATSRGVEGELKKSISIPLWSKLVFSLLVMMGGSFIILLGFILALLFGTVPPLKYDWRLI